MQQQAEIEALKRNAQALTDPNAAAHTPAFTGAYGGGGYGQPPMGGAPMGGAPQGMYG